VVGDDLDTIASGPTVADRSSFGDCLTILRRRGLEDQIPSPVLAFLEAGFRGEIAETPKADDPVFAGIQNLIVGNNRMALDAAGRKAEGLGYTPVFPEALEEGEAQELALEHLALARKLRGTKRAGSRPLCLLTGGEATVTIRGTGKGGRNLEFALAAALELDGVEGITLLSGGTDGTDGPTDAAGAVCDGDTARRGRASGMDPQTYLSANDSYHFFQPLGDLLKTGPTSTNVMDLRVILVS
jgi:hydroxypyruvate reductase